MKSHWAAGNVKMRGKKTKVLRCGCCFTQDFREREKYKFFTNQIKEYKTTNQEV